MNRADEIAERLRRAFAPERIEIHDESHRHAGHAGARDGGGHFEVLIVSPRFRGLTVLQRHRLVYEAVGDMMRREIHALGIRALSPDEL
ncbi:MAG: cell division protein BolA [Candidatus Muproteobacteria bacterium RBG_16_65_34]|uniref:Cell division protein BolA n=1 Tax=Candidatus Muproteobacteria bacterium RBG_16_65_34 TaxID=1817760 RepID=A0A1F6TMA8_9PROT|nr:MAG: cell division protein BolA [Candidatus Muproteobacteria bacterium RBG_16_65_34]